MKILVRIGPEALTRGNDSPIIVHGNKDSLRQVPTTAMTGMDRRERGSLLAALQERAFDIIVIGGGITGAGILREATLRGLRVALLEANDFGAGTSSKSTKLIHGGIRYLQEMQFHVVREAAIERKRVNRLAPHLAQPHWLTLPAKTAWHFAKYRLGVSIYEVLGQVRKPDLHFNLQDGEVTEWEPRLTGADAAVVYREYLTDDARLVVANVRAGVDAGGLAANYCGVTGLRRENQKIAGVEAKCGLTGDEIFVRGAAVINAAGPWVEQICSMDQTAAGARLVLSKGVHVSVPHEALPIRHMALMEHTDGRPVFAIPKQDVTYIGTTDTRYDKPDLWPEVLGSEIDYLFEPVRDYFGTTLTRDDCVSTWAGLRPLVAQGNRKTTQISRRDETWVSPSGLVTIAGGKLTGYRKMAEDTVDRTIELFSLKAASAVTDEPLPGGDIAGTLDNLDTATLERLVSLYGSETAEVIALGEDPVGGDARVLRGELRWAVAKEGICRLEDFVYRRSRNIVFSPNGTPEVLKAIADELSTLMDWSEEEKQDEIDRVMSRWADDLSGTESNEAAA